MSKKLKVGEQPHTKISDKLLESGTQVCVLAGPRSWDIENWIIDVRAQLPQGTEVDWCFQAGRAFVVALGDMEAVRKAIETTKDDLNKTYRESSEQVKSSWGIHDMQFQWSLQ